MKRVGIVAAVVGLGVGLAWAGGFTKPIPGYSQQTLARGQSSASGPGWVWHVFDVSAAATGEPDLLAYNPVTGDYVLVITDHPQFSGFNGSVPTPGDCFVVGRLDANRVLTIADLDRDHRPDVFAYSPTTGAITRWYFRSLGGCDWTDAF